MEFAIVNRTKVISNDEVSLMCAAIQIQLNLHFCPAWGLKSVPVKFFADEASIPNWAWVIYIIDNDQQVEGALGFHQEINDKVDGYIMCEPILSNGGSVLTFDPKTPEQYSVSATLSHEVLETFMDRFTNTWVDCGRISCCLEVCDPVEQIGYPILIGDTLVSVSDFIFPAWTNIFATLPENAPFNYLKTLKEPFSMLEGGYMIVREGGPGTEKQIFGNTMPEYRKAIKQKSFARAFRRTKKI